MMRIWAVSVRDHEIGFHPRTTKDQQLVFEEFRQAAGGATRRHQGRALAWRS